MTRRWASVIFAALLALCLIALFGAVALAELLVRRVYGGR
jgi:hypothetical protein